MTTKVTMDMRTVIMAIFMEKPSQSDRVDLYNTEKISMKKENG